MVSTQQIPKFLGNTSPGDNSSWECCAGLFQLLRPCTGGCPHVTLFTGCPQVTLLVELPSGLPCPLEVSLLSRRLSQWFQAPSAIPPQSPGIPEVPVQGQVSRSSSCRIPDNPKCPWHVTGPPAVWEHSRIPIVPPENAAASRLCIPPGDTWGCPLSVPRVRSRMRMRRMMRMIPPCRSLRVHPRGARGCAAGTQPRIPRSSGGQRCASS